MQEAPNALYHYCSSEAFDAIVRSHTLHVSECRWTNDALENKHSIEVIAHCLPDVFPQREKAEAVRQATYLKAAWKPHRIACLSAKRDLLSQWRAYAADGSGFAIGIDPHRLRIPIDQPQTYKAPMGDSSFVIGSRRALVRVTYDRSILMAAVRVLYRRVHEDGQGFPLQRFHLGLRSLVTCFKHEGFKEEAEWRIVDDQQFTIVRRGGRPRLVELDYPKERKLRRGRLVRYRELPLVIEGQPLITEVIQGPRNQVPPSHLRRLLKDHGLAAVPVAHSGIPYRG
jgi:hypothetical protein